MLQDTEHLTKSVSEVLGGLKIVKAVHSMKNYHLDDFHKCMKSLSLKLNPNGNHRIIDCDLSQLKAIISVRLVKN